MPQVYRTWKIKSALSLSWHMLIISSTAALVWLCYGIILKDKIIILSNSIMGLLQASLIFLKFSLRKNT
ncbi:SemiSWEET family transporter [Flagellimonas taeanensis]|uniref:SemiSWEET family transporter n=1 Tax=Flagellimonas taeanensis TaxID=1005926 RepID=UPI003AAB207D